MESSPVLQKPPKPMVMLGRVGHVIPATYSVTGVPLPPLGTVLATFTAHGSSLMLIDQLVWRSSVHREVSLSAAYDGKNCTRP